ARFPHPLPFIDWIAILLQTLLDGVGILGNVALLLAIFLKAPKNWSSYKILLINGSIIDLIAALSAFLIIERMIPASFGTAIIFLGPCTLISPLFCHRIHAVAINVQTHSIYLCAAGFAYRLFILQHIDSSTFYDGKI
ncbi:hypothetical protein PENTCL1PPCAC_20500, partial [Pristionchus entomophagus]